MKDKLLVGSDLPYDLGGITKIAKKRLAVALIQITCYSLVFVLSVIAIVLFGGYVSVFICGAVLAVVSAVLLSKSLSKLHIVDYRSAVGEITEVHKDVATVRTTKVGGIGYIRKYDTYTKKEVRLGVFLKKDNGEIHACHFNDGTEEMAKYYEEKGQAIHIWGSHFPIKLEIGKEKWLCPICGEFNPKEEKICTKCRNQILK